MSSAGVLSLPGVFGVSDGRHVWSLWTGSPPVSESPDASEGPVSLRGHEGETGTVNTDRQSLSSCLSVCLSVCRSLPVSLSVFLSVCLSAGLYLSLSLFLSVCPQVFTCLPLSLPVCLQVFTCLSLSLSSCLSVCLSAGLYLSLSLSLSSCLSVCRSLPVSLPLFLSVCMCYSGSVLTCAPLYLSVCVQTVVQVLVRTGPSMFRVLLVFQVVWLIFTCLGINLFAGKFYYCYNTTSEELFLAEEVQNKTECLFLMDHNYTEVVWMNSDLNFDSVLSGYLALLHLVSLKAQHTHRKWLKQDCLSLNLITQDFTVSELLPRNVSSRTCRTSFMLKVSSSNGIKIKVII